MRSRQIAEAHKEFVNEEPAREPELAAKQAGPLLQWARAMRVEPGVGRALGLPQPLDDPGIVDDRRNLQPDAHDAEIGQQTSDTRVAYRRLFPECHYDCVVLVQYQVDAVRIVHDARDPVRRHNRAETPRQVLFTHNVG